MTDPTELDLDALEGTPTEWRMSAYYYSFIRTNIKSVDLILSAVACAGKGYHHTEEWTDNENPYDHLPSGTYVDAIQLAAISSANETRTLITRLQSAEAERDALLVQLKLLGDGISKAPGASALNSTQPKES